jgi:hypothetical protein
MDAVEEDAKKLMGVRNWKRTAQDREEWRPRPDSGCCAIEEEEGLLHFPSLSIYFIYQYKYFCS